MQSVLGTDCVCVCVYSAWKNQTRLQRTGVCEDWAGDREEKQQVQRPGVGKWHRWGQQASQCDRGSVVDVARMEGSITCHPAPFIHFIPHFLHV